MLSTVVNTFFLITRLLCILRICCHQGKFRLRKMKPKQENTDRIKVPDDQTKKSETIKQDQDEELPDLKDPEVQKATSLIQVVQISRTTQG